MMAMPKDDAWKFVAVAAVSAIVGGGAGLGGSALQAQSMTVRIEGPIEAELPPKQIELLREQATVSTEISHLRSTVDTFFTAYRQDQAEYRKAQEDIRSAMAHLSQRLGIVERDATGAVNAIREQSERLRMLERRSTNTFEDRP